MTHRAFCHTQILTKNLTRLVQDSTPLQSQVKWLSEKDRVGNLTVNWRNAYYLPFLCTRETKLRVFQFKFLHTRIATNDFLCKIGIKQGLFLFLQGIYWNFGPPVLDLPTNPSLLEKPTWMDGPKKCIFSLFVPRFSWKCIECTSTPLLLIARHHIITYL